MKTITLVIISAVVSLLAAISWVNAESRLNGNVSISSQAEADKVAAEGGRVTLSSVNINNGTINGKMVVNSKTTVGTVTVNEAGKAIISSIEIQNSNVNNLQYKSVANLNGNIDVAEGRLLNLASGSINGVDVSGDVVLDLRVDVRGDVEVGEGGTALLGAVNIEGQNKLEGENTISMPVLPSPIGIEFPSLSIIENPIDPGFQVADERIPFNDLYAEGHAFYNSGGNDLNGHCAWFAQQITRLPGGRTWTIGSLATEKEERLRHHAQRGDGFYRGEDSPKAGNSIIFHGTKKNKWGHVAVINEILPGGKARVTESNAKGNFVVTHERVVNLNDPAIMGFLRTVSHRI